MYLEKLEIQGFKSFAEPTTLLFNTELTCVVGPNGSGKSNVADAIRWVLGEQSLKLLRGKKHEDVIFAGSDRKNRLGFASVKIYLNNESGRVKIDYSQVILERKITRSGESEYLINNNKVRLLDITMLLAQAHIGQKSYSIIGQGMIDSMLTYSTAERKDFFDEATGVKQFQIKKNQAIHKLEQTEDNLQQAALVLQEISPRLSTLKRQVRKLERKEEIDKELNILQTKYYSSLMGNLDIDITKLSSQKEKALSELHKLESKQRDIQREMDTNERATDRTEQFQHLQKKLTNAQEEYNVLTKKRIITEGQKDLKLLKDGAGEIVLQQQRLNELQQRKKSISLKIAELQSSTDKAIIIIKELLENEKKVVDKFQSVERKLLSEHDHIDWPAAEKHAHTLEQEHYKVIKDIEAVQNLNDLTRIKERLHRLGTQLHSWFQQLRQSSTADRQQLMSHFKELSDERESIRVNLQTEEKKYSADKAELEVYRLSWQELQSEIDNLSHLEKKQSTSNSLTLLTKQISDKEKTIFEIQSSIDDFNKDEEKKKDQIVKRQKELRTIQFDFNIKNNELTNIKVELAKLETKKDDLQKEINTEFPSFQLEKHHAINGVEVHERIAHLKKQMHIIGGIDQETQNEFQEVNEKFTFLTQQSTDLQKALKSTTSLIIDLDKKISDQFKSSFKNINQLFSKYFKKLFDGGKASLILHLDAAASTEANEEDIEQEENEIDEKEKPKKKSFKSFDYSIEIHATPPGKKLASIAMLSGGEKALTSIALICAIIANNPSPFVLLDEVDAALDEANSIRFAEIIDELSSKTQFITITHNRATMHQAKILYGVTMGDDNVSRLLSVNFDQAEKLSSEV